MSTNIFNTKIALIGELCELLQPRNLREDRDPRGTTTGTRLRRRVLEKQEEKLKLQVQI